MARESPLHPWGEGRGKQIALVGCEKRFHDLVRQTFVLVLWIDRHISDLT
jgi:hypothetical protein